MKQTLVVILILSFLMIFQVNVYSQSNEDNLIQMAILLDTSSSMDGLIDQAKSQLWKIVNELATSKRNGQIPLLEVALYEYGKSSIPVNEDYLRMIVPLTKDLDLVSDELFKLTTNGGSEYCGAVIKASLDGLKWSKNNKVLKIIFVAGNEPFTQGKVDYVKSCKDAIKQGIVVNTIFCGNYQEGISTKWKDGADLADGQYMNIDQDQKFVYIEAPQDAKIVELNQKLNKTYISYGSKGKEKKELQARQDSNARTANKESEIQRAVTKSSKLYDNSSWDLVDGIINEEVDADKLKDEELPEELKGKSKEEIEKYVKERAKEREEIQKEIQKLNKEREAYLAEERKKQAENNSLDEAIIGAVRDQAKDKGYQFEK